jgi:hypothetical protein
VSSRASLALGSLGIPPGRLVRHSCCVVADYDDELRGLDPPPVDTTSLQTVIPRESTAQRRRAPAGVLPAG